jgi:hypothetical protein
MNFACKEAEFSSRYFNENLIFQSDHFLHKKLTEYFGEEDVIQTKAAVLKVELELGEYDPEK